MAPTTQPGITKKATKLMTSDMPLSDSCTQSFRFNQSIMSMESSLRRLALREATDHANLTPRRPLIKFHRPYRAVGVPVSAVRLDTPALPAYSGRAGVYQRVGWQAKRHRDRQKEKRKGFMGFPLCQISGLGLCH